MKNLPDLYTFIEIESEQTLIIQEDKINGVKTEKALPIGTVSVSRKYFKQDLPTPSELEVAITDVEDELMLYLKSMITGTELFASNETLKEIATYVLPVSTEKNKITATDVEIIFGRLGAIISGRPASTDVLPMDSAFIVRVLILREILAHLKFKYITVC